MEVKKAVIPAAGLGTRMLPITKAQPKEMVPVFDKPTIQWVVEEAYHAGIDDMLIITGKHKRAIEDHFDRFIELENAIKNSEKEKHMRDLNEILENVTIHFVRQKEPRGLGDAIYHARKHIGSEPFVVLLGDVITSPNCTKQMIENFRENTNLIAVNEVPREETYKYGIIAFDKSLRIIRLVEKPSPENAPSNYAILGRYILQPEIFDCIRETKPDKKGEIQLTDALQILKDRTPMHAFVFNGKVHDIGNKLSWLKSTFEMALQSEIGEELKKHVLELLGVKKIVES
jgi:UTP--glucose-1-phosphate uridylyltransferase